MFLFNFRKLLNHRITVLSITAALAFFVAWQAGSLVWKLWLLNEESPPPADLIALSLKNTEPESLQNLLRYPLIRTASTPATQDSAAINAPKTSLKLKLVGLMYSTDKNQARAIIETPEEGARSFATRERVADNAEIYSIEPDRVILMHAGRQEALMLNPEQKPSGSPTDTGNQPVNDQNTKQVSTEAQNRNETNTEPQAETTQKLANVPKNMEELMRDFSATPVMENGVLLGFRLKALRNPELMKGLGIDPNEVITAVNGIPLNAPGRIMVLYDKLKRQREFEITLNNGGNSRTIAINLYE